MVAPNCSMTLGMVESITRCLVIMVTCLHEASMVTMRDILYETILMLPKHITTMYTTLLCTPMAFSSHLLASLLTHM